MKKGLILEGGAMRGIFTCGVLDVFMENGVTFDGAAGISAGAVFGCNFKSGQIGRAVRYNKKYCRDPRYCSVISLIKTGDLYGADFCYRELPDKLDVFDRAAFKNNPMEFYIGATDIETGEAVFHKCTDGGREDLEWMRASASMPIVSRPVKIGGYTLLDGGIAVPVPYLFMESAGYGRNVAILTQPKGYVKKKSSAYIWARLFLHKYPKVAEALETRHERYNKQMREIEERERSGALFVIRPPKPLGISRTESDPEALERVYSLGRSEGALIIDKVLRFLNG